jgi:hypothetical protein
MTNWNAQGAVRSRRYFSLMSVMIQLLHILLRIDPADPNGRLMIGFSFKREITELYKRKSECWVVNAQIHIYQQHTDTTLVSLKM